MTEEHLERRIGLVSATMIGIGGTIGSALFIMVGKAAGMAGPAVFVTFLVGAIINYFTAFNYSELAASLPMAGGGYTFTKAAIGKFPAFLTGWFMWFGNMFYATLCALGVATGVKYFVPGVNEIVVAIIVELIFMTMSIRGAGETGMVQNLMTVTMMGALVVYIILGFLHGTQPGTFENFTPYGWSKVFWTVGYVFVCFVGFEIISTVSGEIKNPGKTIPRAILISLTVCTIVYVLAAYISVGIIRYDELAASSTALSDVAKIFMGEGGGTLMAAAMIIASLAALNAAMIASARISFALSRDGYFPATISKIQERFKTPYMGVLLSSLLIVLFTSIGAADFAGYVADFGYIVGLSLVNFSVIWMRRRHPGIPRPYKVPLYPYTPIIGALSSFVVLPTLHIEAIAFGLLWVILGLLVYYMIMLGPIRLKIAFGGMNIGLGALSLTALLLIVGGVLPVIVSPAFQTTMMAALLIFGGLQIVAGILNMRG
ncbi:MAG: APC family permease [Candidatus Bathyarchaeia archaeon]